MSHAITASRATGICRFFISLLCLVLLQIACTSGDQPESVVTPSAGTPMKFSVPGGDAFLRVVNIDTVMARIEWRLSDGSGSLESRDMTRNGGTEVWESPSITFAIDTSYDVTVTWSATGVDGANVVYAQQNYSYTSTIESDDVEPAPIDLSDQSYNYDRFDSDSDSVNNYQELLAETSPTSPDSCRQGGSDPSSSNGSWNDNCSILYEPATDGEPEQRSPYYHSTYSQAIQRVLYCQGYAPADQTIEFFADGYYGPNTYQAVREFQATEGLPVDGDVGPATWGALQEQVDVDNDDTLITVHSDDKYKAYGISRSMASIEQMIDDCSQITHFFRRFSDSSDIDGWEMATIPGENVKGPFSIAEP